MDVPTRLAALREQLADAASRAGRSLDGITLVGVCKRQPLERILKAVEHGVSDLGESTAQGLRENAEAMARAGKSIRWHFIGRLQQNKAKLVAQYAAVVHSVDSLALADALERRADAAGRSLEVLVQVNLGREAQKGGVLPEQAVGLARVVAQRPHLVLRGLMAIPPHGHDPSPYFAELRCLSQALTATPEGRTADALSMGMSEDFAAAVAHGATIVRVGTGIFGDRNAQGGRTGAMPAGCASCQERRSRP